MLSDSNKNFKDLGAAGGPHPVRNCYAQVSMWAFSHPTLCFSLGVCVHLFMNQVHLKWKREATPKKQVLKSQSKVSDFTVSNALI